MKRIILASALAAATLGGCYHANIHLADGAGMPGAVNEQFHLSVIGLFELSAPIDLKAACSGGQAVVIHDHMNFIGGLITDIVGFISVMTPTVDCGGGSAPAAPTGPAPE